MKITVLVGLFIFHCIEAKLSPFVPRENNKVDIDIAKAQYLKLKAEEALKLEQETTTVVNDELSMNVKTTENDAGMKFDVFQNS